MLEQVKIPQVWSMELFQIDGSSVTVSQVVLGIVFFILGYIAIRFVTAAFDRRILGKTDMDITFRHMVRSISFYSLLIILMLFTLGVLGIPLTAFTIVGGAFAIGIGFGSQNIINNLISGLIVMFERPVRINDFIEIDGLTGRVEKIGPRATVISSMGNTWIVIPNSFFLEKMIRNWTLSDEIIRTSVTVGVAYGSDTKKTQEILMEQAQKNDKVLSHPEPFVLFQDFGDNSLDFELFVWVRALTPIDCRQVESQLRFAIDSAFRKADICIAFPQRDVHLDTVSPLKVQMLKSED